MKLINAVKGIFLGFALVACGSTGSMAHLARTADVTHCKPLGEVVVESDPTKSATNDRIAALEQSAARQGATDVVSEGGAAANGSLKGEMYECADNNNARTRSEGRAGL